MGKARRRRRAPTSGGPPAAPAPPRPARRSVLLAVGGAVGAAVTALVVAGATGLVGQVIDVPAAKDRVRQVRDRVFHRSAPSTASPEHRADGDGLGLSVLDVDGSYGRTAAFPAEPADSYRPFFRSADLPSMPSLLAAGGYAVGGLRIKVSIGSRRNEKIDVFDVRPVDLRRQEVTAGVLVYVLNQGSPVERMSFDLDSPRPTARLLGEGVESGPGTGYFDVQTVPLDGPGATAVLSLEFVTIRWSYTFDVDVHYHLGGRSYVQRLPRGPGGPYRVTADLCQLPTFRDRLAPADRTRLGRLRYGAVRSLDEGADGYMLRTRSGC
jgi:hypothetical protein